MWNRHAFLIWFSVRIEGKHRFHIALPIPIYLFLMFTELFEDLAALTPIFWHRHDDKEWHGMEVSPLTVMRIAAIFSGLSREFVLHAEPIDLIDVDITDRENRIRVRCLLR